MKIYRGYELMQAIAERKIKEGTEFIFKGEDDYEESVIWNGENIKYKNSNENLLKDIPDYEFIYGTFELIENEEIDIQDIEIIKEYRTSDNDLYNDNFEDFRGTINDLVQAVKQLDKRIRKEKEYEK